jgi:hypothetical protein
MNYSKVSVSAMILSIDGCIRLFLIHPLSGMWNLTCFFDTMFINKSLSDLESKHPL